MDTRLRLVHPQSHSHRDYSLFLVTLTPPPQAKDSTASFPFDNTESFPGFRRAEPSRAVGVSAAEALVMQREEIGGKTASNRPCQLSFYAWSPGLGVVSGNGDIAMFIATQNQLTLLVVILEDMISVLLECKQNLEQVL